MTGNTKNTGYLHKSELVLRDGTIYVSEDIRRDNVIDSVIGRIFLNKKDIEKSVLYVTKRLSREMVVKCIMHKIPVIVSKTAVTFQRIKSANANGSTLIGFTRNSKMNIYTHFRGVNS